MLSVLSRVYVVVAVFVVVVIVVVVIYLFKGLYCCWLLVLFLVYIYVLMCLFSTSINKVRVTTIISQ